jgi:hypothetical protein
VGTTVVNIDNAGMMNRTIEILEETYDDWAMVLYQGAHFNAVMKTQIKQRDDYRNPIQLIHHRIYTTTPLTISEGEERDRTTNKRLRSAYKILKEAVHLHRDEYGGLGVFAKTTIRPGQLLPYGGRISRTTPINNDYVMSLHEYLPDQYKNVCIVGTHHIGEPTGQMVNCGGWEKDEHGKFSEKANPEINCELIIGAWENKGLNILATEEEAMLLLFKWCDEEEVPTENISAFVRVTKTIRAGSQLLLNYGQAYWTDVNEHHNEKEPESVRTDSDNIDNLRFSVKQSTLPFQGAGQGLFTKVPLEKGDRVLDYITLNGQDRSTNSEQICLLTREEYGSKYPNNDATHVLMVEGVTRRTDGEKVRYADAVDGGIGGKINRSIAIDGFRQNVRFNKNGRLIAINRILPGEELFTNYGPQLRLPTIKIGLANIHNTTLRLGKKRSKAQHIMNRCKKMIGKTKNNALTQFVENTRKEMLRYKDADLKYDLARGFLEWNNPEDEGTRPIESTHVTGKPPGYIMNKFFPNHPKHKRSENADDEGNKKRKTENTNQIICTDDSNTENELNKKRKIDYPPVTEVIVKKQKMLHTARKKRKRNGEVYRNNRQKKKKHEIIVID